MSNQYDLAIVGAGFTGLTAGLEAARAGLRVVILESDSEPGGLAGTFEFSNGVRIEKFYHHWFNNDVYVPELVRELGLDGQVVTHPSRTGLYFNGRMWNLSTPLDLFKFKPLSLVDRIRLGLLVLQVRRVKDWKTIEHLSIREWLEPICGPSVYRIVWKPLIDSKFSVYADDVNAVWFWKKLVLRGGTRDKSGGEELAYFKGGFGRLAEAISQEIVRLGGKIVYRSPVTSASVDGGRVTALETAHGPVTATDFLFTPALSIVADMFKGTGEEAWVNRLRRVRYLGNMCLSLQLDRSLSKTYWLNVNDPGFPFVGVIEHTNFDPPEFYKGSHIVYLSRYLPTEDPVWSYSNDKYLEFALEHLKRMFPKFERSWIIDFQVWRAEYAQPVTERNYSQYVPGRNTPYVNAFVSTMAQIYPEDRGTNYAIREGKDVAKTLIDRKLRHGVPAVVID